MKNMFADCSNLISVDLSEWNTASVKNMSYMFAYGSSLTSVDLSKWNVEKVTNMSYMFSNCSSLTNIGDINDWNTENVANMESMFSSCSSLTNIDLSKWNVESVTNMSYMFDSCTNLKVILLGENFSKIVSSRASTFINNPTAIITTRTEAMSFDANTTTSNAVLYVPSVAAEAAFEAADTNNVFGVDRIRTILELIGEEKIEIEKGTEYVENGVTVAGFNSSEEENYTQFGFNLENEGTVNTEEEGTYNIVYTLTRNNQSISQATRVVTVIGARNYTDGKNYYKTLKEAFEKAPSGATITVLKDVTETSNE